MAARLSSRREKFRGLSPAEFFYKNREIAGFSNPVRALYQTIRELVENALDATETHGILPEIKVNIKPLENDHVFVRVEDNGIGIPPTEIPIVFGRVFYGSKYQLRQTRGVFGLGVKMAVLYAQITTGKPLKVVSTQNKSKYEYEFEIQIDIAHNMPIIKNMAIREKTFPHGTIVELITEGNWTLARRKIESYLERTAMIAPYATIVLEELDSKKEYRRVSKVLPPPPETGKYHPKGADLELVKNMIRRSKKSLTLMKFLMENFDGVGKKTAENFLTWAGFDPETKLSKLTLQDIEILVRKMKEYEKWRRPKPITLSPVGESLLKQGVKRILNPSYVTAVTRPPSSFGGNPFIVEVALAYGGNVPQSDTPTLYRFANRIPLLYDEGADVSRKVISSIDWSIYKVKFPAPLAIVTHICSTKIPFKGVGKEAIAEVPEVEKELEIAIREAARRLRRHLSKLEKLYEVKRRKTIIGKYIPEVSRALAYVSNLDEKVLAKKLQTMLEKDIKTRGVINVPAA